ncbi:MAG: class A beta-lactamase-related serine hydrolase [Bacteroidetes bacterium CHB5]|nr:class A beta-lactamase-related serine hydrolase [Bacteroidetes bacterium CHB5]
MNRIGLFLLVFVSCQQPVETKKILTPAQPESIGMSTARLARLDSTFTKWVDAGWMNGALAFIARDGKIVYHKATGYNNIETKEPLKPDGIYRIASQTKAITSVAVMMLWEEGKFLLDDPISKYIPAFANQTVLDTFIAKDTTYTTNPAKRQATIRDLLTHTSGIGYAQIGSLEANAIYAKNNITAGLYVSGDGLEDAMNRLGPLPLMHQPGAQWTYGLNTDLLGRLVEVWSGKTLDAFFTERIFKPLGMHDTYFNLPAEKASRLVNFYQEDSTGLKLQSKVFGVLDMSYPLKEKTYFSGGGGLSSTIYDYAIFLQMLLNGGEYNGVRILSRNTVRLMTMNQIGDLNLGVNKFGLGFEIVSEKGSAQLPHNIGTFSWGGAFSTTYWVDPKEKLVVLLYRQMWGQHGADVDQTFKVQVYQALND